MVLRYGPNKEIIEDTIYFSGDTDEVIEEKEFTRDLGIIMQNNGSFEKHIEKVCSKVRQKSGWFYRSFYSRKPWFLRHMWNQLIQPHIDYASQLWFPGEGRGEGHHLEKLEKLLKDFISKIPALQGLDYWQRVKEMKMNSEQRRMERYKIIYTWKSLEGLVPDSGVTLAGEDDRLGRRCEIRSLKPKERMKRESSFQVSDPKLFNCLPQKLRDLKGCGVDIFKEKLDDFLCKVPDEPKIGGLMPQNSQQSNSLLWQVGRRI